jgi:hypothetical protein
MRRTRRSNPWRPGRKEWRRDGDPALVDRVRVRTDIDEVRDHVALGTGIAQVGASVGGVVERFCSSTVARANCCAAGDDHLGESPLMGGRRNVQRRVPRVDVMADRNEEVRLGILAARAGPERTVGEAGFLIEQSHDLELVARRDRGEEREQRSVVGLVGLPIGHGHRTRLPRAGHGDHESCT